MRQLPLMFAAALAFAMGICAAPQASEFPGLADSRHVIDRIHAEAKRVARRSVPVCDTAACVKGDCSAIAPVATPMHRAAAWLTEYQKQLEAWRAFQMDLAQNQFSEAQFSQEKADELRELQLLQDALQTFGNTIIEVVAWADLVEGYAQKAKDALVKAQREKFDWELFLFVESHIKKIESIVDAWLGAYDRVFKFADQDTRWGLRFLRKTYDLAILIVKLKDNVNEFRSLWESGDKIGSEKFKLVRRRNLLRVSKIVKLVGDIAIEYQRQERSARIDQYMKQNFAEHLVALNALGAAREINDVIQKADRAKQEIDLALRGAELCAQRICKAALPGKPDIKIVPPPKRGIPDGIKHFNAKLRVQEVLLDAYAGRYKILADFQSRINLRSDTIDQSTSLNGLYHISNRCIPKDARFHVFRLENDKRGKSVLKLKTIERPDGRLRFRVNEDLSGEWKDERGRRYTIAVKKNAHSDDISLTLDNVPRRGRKRIYSGSSRALPARPGKYQLVLFSPGEDQFYLPTPFIIESKGKAPENLITLRSFPYSVEDLSPKLRDEIANAVLIKILSERLSYKAILKPNYEADNTISLPIEFWSYKFKWNETDGELAAGSFRENMSRERLLQPATGE